MATKRFSKPLRLLLPALLFLILAGGLGFYLWVLKDLPDIHALSGQIQSPSVRIEDRNGRLLYEMLPAETGRHVVIPLDQIPLALQQATIATEDNHFYQNPGVDVRGIARALWINLRGGESLAGGSTLTQQVARNLLLNPSERGQRTLRRKLRESVLAWQISRAYSKEQVLALYLNQTYYGNLSYGVEAAAQTYFGKPAAQLDLAECALLAGLPQAPALYDPFNEMDAARKRQAVVLNLMQKNGYITPQQQALAEREPFNLASQPFPMEAPHFVMMVRAQLDGILTPEALQSGGGWVVQTTLDLNWQRQAENAVQNQLERLRTQTDDPFGHNLNNAAVVALDPRSGEIRAMVGSPDYFDAQHAGAVNMAIAPRQPGSALKPLIYAAAFDPAQAQPWTPATMLLDVTSHFTTHDGKVYIPANYDGLEHGPVLVREALASSLNVPAVIALDHIGLRALYAFASRLGITTLGDPNQADLSIALGGGEVRLLDLTAAYGAFANGGKRVSPFAIQEVRSSQGEVRYHHTPAETQRVMDERVAWLISDMLSDDNARLLGFGRNSILRLDRPAAVKTGTTTNYHDNWTIGYTPDLVVGVWAGNASHEAMHNVTGLTGAAPIWAQSMRSLLSGQPQQPFIHPPGLVRMEVCALSGLLPTPACPYRKQEWFIDQTQPTQKDTFWQQELVDRATGALANEQTPLERLEGTHVLTLPPQAENWARSVGMPLMSDLMRSSDQAAASPDSTAELQIISPAPNAVFHLAEGLPLDSQRIRVQAVGPGDLVSVSLWVDGAQIARMEEPPYQSWWQLAKGKHTLLAEGVRVNGQTIRSPRIAFEVK